jgi:hypothetical protein
MNDAAYILYAVCAAILFGGAAFAARRRAQAVSAKGPGVIISLLIWFAIIAAVATIYFAFQVWGGLLGVLN